MPTAPQTRASLIAPSERVACFPEVPFQLRNSLPAHPLFTPDRIAGLLARIPKEAVEIRHPETRDQHDGRYRRRRQLLGYQPVQAFENLENNPLWMNVHHVERYDAGFRDLLAEYLKTLMPFYEEMGQEVFNFGCFLILSSGKGVVHFHSDPDQSFLNQIRGAKTIYIYPSKILKDPLIERLLVTEDQGVIQYQPDFENVCFDPIVLRPGDTTFIPLYAPHRVINQDEVSYSLSIGFNTRKSLRRKRIHLLNARIRKVGVPVTPFGISKVGDSAKDLTFQMSSGVLRALRNVRNAGRSDSV